MILHTLNKAPGTLACKNCLNTLNYPTTSDSSQDSLLLLEDGVYLADHANAKLLEGLPKNIYAIDADVEARGLLHRLLPQVTLVSYADFVRLVTEHKLTKSWQ
jgi:tRNA 2-thiouridine synthesizing protein B